MSKTHQTLPALRAALQAAGYKIHDGPAVWTSSNVEWYAYCQYDAVKGFFDVSNPGKGPQVVLVPYDFSGYSRSIPLSMVLSVQWSLYEHRHSGDNTTCTTKVTRDTDDLSIDNLKRHCNELASIAVAIQQLN